MSEPAMLIKKSLTIIQEHLKIVVTESELNLLNYLREKEIELPDNGQLLVKIQDRCIVSAEIAKKYN